ncbi:MAG: glycosyltransferase [Pseudomonadales bacterium]|nr:glycosyltransferase [Pseudomonadales bacterium]
MYNIKIIRPIAWSDIRASGKKLNKAEYFEGDWNGIPILFPTYYFIPRYAMRFRATMFLMSMRSTFYRYHDIPDIFFSSWAYPDAYATMQLAKKHNRPMVMSVLGSDINVLPKHPKQREKIQRVLEFASAIYSPSEALRKLVIELGCDPDKVHVVYSGIDNARFFPRNRDECEAELGLEKGKKRIIYVGNYRIAKGTMDLLYAVKKLASKRTDFEVLLIGKGEAEAEVRNYVATNQLDSVVNVVGEVSHHELNTWMNASDCLSLPSYNEGLPNVVLEALKCEINVVATNVGGIPEAVADSEMHLVNPGDIDALADKLDAALFDSSVTCKPGFEIPTYQQMAERVFKLTEQAHESFLKRH